MSPLELLSLLIFWRCSWLFILIFLSRVPHIHLALRECMHCPRVDHMELLMTDCKYFILLPQYLADIGPSVPVSSYLRYHHLQRLFFQFRHMPLLLGLHYHPALTHGDLINLRYHLSDFGNLFHEQQFCNLFFIRVVSDCFLSDLSVILNSWSCCLLGGRFSFWFCWHLPSLRKHCCSNPTESLNFLQPMSNLSLCSCLQDSTSALMISF